MKVYNLGNMIRKKTMLFCILFVFTICFVGCENKNALTETESQEAIAKRAEEEAKKKTTKINVADNSNYDTFLKENESVKIEVDSLSSTIVMQELYYINIDEKNIYIRCSETDFNILKEKNKTQAIHLVYKPIDEAKYIVMYENEQMLLAYKFE